MSLQQLDRPAGDPPAGAPAPLPSDARARTGPRLPTADLGVVVAGGFLVLVAVAAVAPDLLIGADPLAVDPSASLTPPGAQFPLGSDEAGRDVLARLVHGTRQSIVMGLGATLIGTVGGTALGLLAGLGRRLVEGVVMRSLDVALAVPELVLALVVISLVGGGTTNAVLAVGIGSIPFYARLVRAQTHLVRRSSYVEAATTLGLGRTAVVRRHVLPNAVRPLLTYATIGIGTAIGAGASLSFLGLGATPPDPEWGASLAVARNYVEIAPWLVLAPATALTLTVVAVTVVGRAARDRTEGRRA